MARRRVLHLADSPYVGGITSHLVSVADAFRGDPDWEIVLATLPGKHGDETLYDRAQSLGFDVSTIEMASTFDMQVRGRLRDFADVNHIAVVHTHGYRGNVVANLSRLTVPIVTTSHGLAVQPSMRLRLWQAMHLHYMRHQPVLLACSAFVAGELRDRGVPEGRIAVVRNACSMPPQDVVEPPRAELAIADDAIVLLFVGRLDAGKQLDVVIEALERLPQFHLVVVGDGPSRPVFESVAKRLGIKASFVGVNPDPAAYYAIADVVVLPTEMEALPMALIEAAAFGKPAIASNVGGVPEVVEDGVTGFLVRDAKGWSDALSRLSDADTRARMGDAARKRHRELFSLDALRQALAEVYGAVTAQ